MKAFSALFSLALLTGCVSVRSNVKPDAVPSFSRILVVTKMDRPPRDYEQRYLNAFPQGYEVCVLGLTPISFGHPDSTVAEQAQRCKSDVVLTISELRPGGANYALPDRNSPTGVPQSEYLVEMRSSTSGEAFWKAQLSTSAIYGRSLWPSTVVKRLIKDGLLTGKMPTSNERTATR